MNGTLLWIYAQTKKNETNDIYSVDISYGVGARNGAQHTTLAASSDNKTSSERSETISNNIISVVAPVTSLNDVWQCTIEKKECEQYPYAVIMALTDFLTHAELPQVSIIHFYVDQLHTYNILKSYLVKWIKHDFIDSQGHRIPFHDILQSFMMIMNQKKYQYKCTYMQ